MKKLFIGLLALLAASTVHGSVQVFDNTGAEIGHFTELSCGSNITCSKSSGKLAYDVKSPLDLAAASTDSTIGTVNSPVSGTTAIAFERYGNFFVLTVTLTASQIPVTDGAGSGSHGSLKLLDFAEGVVGYMKCRQDYTAFAEGAALTGDAGDAVFEIGVGTTAISAADDGTLGATEDDICGDVNVTLSGGTGTGTISNNSTAVADGSSSATDLNLNWSGTAATIDANSTIDVTGTLTVVGVLMGDD